MLLLISSYLIFQRRAPIGDQGEKKKRRFFIISVLLLWIATDWPLGLLGASYLASAHMLQFLIYTMAVAPLFWLGIPEWMARRVAGRLRLYRLMGRVAQPVVGGVLFNFILIVTHSPWAVDNFRTNQFGSFLMDFVWFIGGLLV